MATELRLCVRLDAQLDDERVTAISDELAERMGFIERRDGPLNARVLSWWFERRPV